MEPDPVNSFITPLEAFGGVPDWWEPLFQASSNASVFLSAAWLQSWLEVYGTDFDGFWVRWEHGGVTVGGCLLTIRTVYKGILPIRTCSLNASGNASKRTPTIEYNDILHIKGFEEAIAADFARVMSTFKWHRLLIDGHPEHALLSRFISRIPQLGVQSELKPARFAELSGSPETPFEATLSGKVGSHIRRNRKLFEQKLGTMHVRSAASLEEAIHYFLELSRLSNARWEGTDQTGTFTSPAIVDFHRRLIARLWALKTVNLICVGNESATVGYLYNFIHGGKVQVFQTGFVYEQESKLSPGMLTHLLAINHYRSSGFDEYDFLAGDSLYKRSLAKGERKLYWTAVYNQTRYVRLLMSMRRMKSRITKAVARMPMTSPDRSNRVSGAPAILPSTLTAEAKA
jgi:CelD/BcsL family acetyltransferase involved in cellulose biosynthesis